MGHFFVMAGFDPVSFVSVYGLFFHCGDNSRYIIFHAKYVPSHDLRTLSRPFDSQFLRIVPTFRRYLCIFYYSSSHFLRN